MSDMVDMMLDGIICMHCGSIVDGNASGYPRSCGCQGDLEESEDFYVPIWESGNNQPKKKKKKRRNKKKKSVKK